MADMMSSYWLRFVAGPRDGECVRLTIPNGQHPPSFWRHVTTIDEPMHLYERAAFKEGTDGRMAWVYEYIGKSTRPAHKFSTLGKG